MVQHMEDVTRIGRSCYALPHARPVNVLYCPLPEDAWLHMTLAVAVPTPEGIVIAADGRVSSAVEGGLAKHGQDDTRKIYSLGKFGLAAAGFRGLTEELLRLMEREGTLDGCTEIYSARNAAEAFIRSYVRKFEGGRTPPGSLLIAGYTEEQEPLVFVMHSHFSFHPGPFHWVGTERGGSAAEGIALLLMNGWEAQTLEKAKVFATLAVTLASNMDAAVGEPCSLAVVTPDGYTDVSNEIADLAPRQRALIASIRQSFRAA